MGTSDGKKKEYRKYGKLHFSIEGKEHVLSIYQSLLNHPEYHDYRFLPFYDFTTGENSYGGGRYIDLHISKGKTRIIAFNKVYNPYCACSTGYSCPLPPRENTLDISIEAGAMAPEEH